MSSRAELPQHLRIETYFLDEIQHVKNHVLGMLELCMPDFHTARLAEAEDWQKVANSFEGQFQVLFGSLEILKPQLGDEMYATLVSMGEDAKHLLLSGDYKAAAFKLQDMDDLGWSQRAQGRRRAR